MTLARRILERAQARGVMLVTAESCTGGLIAARLTDVPGSSAALHGGFVTYSNAAKVGMLGVSPDTLDRVGAVSEEVAREMAEGALRMTGCGLALSVTGIAGPGGSAHKPEGRVCFGVAAQSQTTRVETVEFGPLGRDAVREAACTHGLTLILTALS